MLFALKQNLIMGAITQEEYDHLASVNAESLGIEMEKESVTDKLFSKGKAWFKKKMDKWDEPSSHEPDVTHGPDDPTPPPPLSISPTPGVPIVPITGRFAPLVPAADENSDATGAGAGADDEALVVHRSPSSKSKPGKKKKPRRRKILEDDRPPNADPLADPNPGGDRGKGGDRGVEGLAAEHVNVTERWPIPIPSTPPRDDANAKTAL